MATHSSVLAWRIPWTEEPGGLPSMGLHRVGHDWSELAAAAACMEVVGQWVLKLLWRCEKTIHVEIRHFAYILEQILLPKTCEYIPSIKNNKSGKWSSREVGKVFQWVLPKKEKHVKTCSISLISKGTPINTTVMWILSLDWQKVWSLTIPRVRCIVQWECRGSFPCLESRTVVHPLILRGVTSEQGAHHATTGSSANDPLSLLLSSGPPAGWLFIQPHLCSPGSDARLCPQAPISKECH